MSAQYKLGKGPAAPDPKGRTLKIGNYLPAALPPPPKETFWRLAIRIASLWGKMLNDLYGCCVVSGAGHEVQCRTANANRLHTISDNTVERVYFMLTGGRDIGLNMLQFLKWWRKNGLEPDGEHKIEAFASVNKRKREEVMQTIHLFGGILVGMSLPNFACPKYKGAPDWMTIPWELPSFWRLKPSAWRRPDNGHCVAIFDYDERGLWCLTWGGLKFMTWDYFFTYCDEAYVTLTKDWINEQSKKAPCGVDYPSLLADVRRREAA